MRPALRCVWGHTVVSHPSKENSLRWTFRPPCSSYPFSGTSGDFSLSNFFWGLQPFPQKHSLQVNYLSELLRNCLLAPLILNPHPLSIHMDPGGGGEGLQSFYMILGDWSKCGHLWPHSASETFSWNFENWDQRENSGQAYNMSGWPLRLNM